MGKTSNGAGCGLEPLALKFQDGEGWLSTAGWPGRDDGSDRGFPGHRSDGGNLPRVSDGKKVRHSCRNPARAQKHIFLWGEH